jgi:hypothetical protein
MRAGVASGVTEVQLPLRVYPNGYKVTLSGGCYDDQSVPGRILVQADDGAGQVTLTIAP